MRYQRLLRMVGIAAASLWIFLGRVEGASIGAESVSLRDVEAAVRSAHDGDTVIVPAGTASWTSTLTIGKSITLQGAGDDKTVILDDVPRESRHREQRGQRGPERNERWRQREQKQGQQQRELGQLERPDRREAERSRGALAARESAPPRRRNVASGISHGVIAVELRPNQYFRLSGFTFRYGSVANRPQGGACLIIRGTSPSLRIDHCHFDQLYQRGILVHGWIYGVVDHNRWDVRAGAGTIQSIIVNNGATWGGGSNDYGDGSWAAPTDFGSKKFLFIENNTIDNLGEAQTGGVIDCQDGGRYVSRFNTLKNCAMISGHGTESGGRHRGQRAIEFYDNTDTATHREGIGITRSGTILYHHNTWTGPITPRIPLVIFRETWPYKWGGANGENPWDVNDTEGNGTNVPGHKPHLYASGKHTGPNGSSGTLICAGAGWKPNQWAGFMLTNTTQANRWGGYHCSRIESNTSDTIVYNTQTPDGQPKTFNTGDRFVIYKVLVALDQPGRGKCDLLAGNPAYNTKTGGIAWPHQGLEPIYSWSNRLNGSLVKVESNYPTLKENRDYYNETASFNGTVGVGVGPLAQRPKTCTPGVAYWATDEGEWDSTHDGPDGQLYVCTAPNTWSLYYKPYVYPHPLVTHWPPPQSQNGKKGEAELMGD
jgi:hypothetical protein